VLLVFQLEVEVVIYLSPLSGVLAPDRVDAGWGVQANRAVRTDPLVRNDLVRAKEFLPRHLCLPMLLKSALSLRIRTCLIFNLQGRNNLASHER
jgi:hypothetical protein